MRTRLWKVAVAGALFASGVVCGCDQQGGKGGKSSTTQNGGSTTASGGQPSGPTGTPPGAGGTASAVFDREVEIADAPALGGTGGEPLVINNTTQVADFSYREIAQSVYVSKTFLTSFPTFPKGITSADETSFRKHSFYLYPNVIVTRNEIDAALDAAIKAPPVATVGDTRVYKLEFFVRFINDELRAAAAAAVNKRYSGAAVPVENVVIVPYQYLELRARTSDGPVRLGSYPDVGVGPTAKLGSHPELIKVAVTGSEALLRGFAKEPRVDAVFHLSGFRVRQNIGDFGLAQFARLGFHHFLTGDAAWSELSKYKNGSAGLKIGPVSASGNGGYLEAKKTSFVSREQVKELTREFASDVLAKLWTEIDGDTTALADRMLQTLLDQAAGTWEAALVASDQTFVIDPNLTKDLAPDTVQKVNNGLKTKLNSQEKREATIGKVKASTDQQYTDDDDVTWGTEGTQVVPKSVRLRQYNNASFSKLATRGFVHTKATGSEQALVVPGLISRVATTVRPVPQKTAEVTIAFKFEMPQGKLHHSRGSDEELHSEGGKDIHYYVRVLPVVPPGGASKLSVGYYFHGGEHRSNKNSTTWESGPARGQHPKLEQKAMSPYGTFDPPSGTKILKILNGAEEFAFRFVPKSGKHSGEFAVKDEPGHALRNLIIRGDDQGDDGGMYFKGDVAVRCLVLVAEQTTETVTNVVWE